MLFDFQVVGGFPAIFLFLISSWILLWPENMLSMVFVLFKFVEVFFTVQDVVYLGRHPKRTRVPLLLGGVAYKCQWFDGLLNLSQDFEIINSWRLGDVLLSTKVSG